MTSKQEKENPRFLGPGASYELVQEIYSASVSSDNGGYLSDGEREAYKDMLERISCPIEELPNIFDLPEE